MRNIVKYLGVGLLVVGLTACDQKKEQAPTSDNAAETDSSSASTHQASQGVSLLDGRLQFSLPEGMSDRSDKLGSQSTNMHVYADDTGQRAIIVITGDANSESLEVLANRLQQQQRSRDPQLQVVANRAITSGSQQAQRLDSVISTNGKTSWSTVVLAKVEGRLITLQISLPADEQQQAQSEADNIVKSLVLK